MKVAVLRKVSALIIAAALIIISAVPAFAVIYDFHNSFPAFTRVRFINDSTVIDDYYGYGQNPEFDDFVYYPNDGNLTFYKKDFNSFDSNSNLGFWLHSEDMTVRSSTGESTIYYTSQVPSSGYYSIVFSFTSDTDLTSLLSSATHRLRVVSSKDSFDDDFRYVEDVTFDYFVLRPQNVSQGNKYLNTITITFFLPPLSDSEFRLNYYLYHSSFSISGIDNFSVNTSFMSSTYHNDNWQNSLLLTLTKGFDKITSTLFGLRNSDDENYNAVTDPSTSQEIQDTQQMIDNVENFEASLNQSITTEFNKIDFTTPTNLAAPVAFVGDKVTRTLNSLGSYQPVVFVPLTLGIMLIFLGRGVSALGGMRPSSRFDPLDHIRDNSHDERWLW